MTVYDEATGKVVTSTARTVTTTPSSDTHDEITLNTTPSAESDWLQQLQKTRTDWLQRTQAAKVATS